MIIAIFLNINFVKYEAFKKLTKINKINMKKMIIRVKYSITGRNLNLIRNKREN